MDEMAPQQLVTQKEAKARWATELGAAGKRVAPDLKVLAEAIICGKQPAMTRTVVDRNRENPLVESAKALAKARGCGVDVLDAGTGLGYGYSLLLFTDFFRHVSRLVLADITERKPLVFEAFRSAGSKVHPRLRETAQKVSFLCADAEHLPFQDSSFDILKLDNTFQYLDHACFLEEAKRVVRHGGKIIMHIDKTPRLPFSDRQGARAYFGEHGFGVEFVSHKKYEPEELKRFYVPSFVGTQYREYFIVRLARD